MNLKPFRDYSEHEVVNFFSLNSASGDKGSAVSLVPTTGTKTAAAWDVNSSLSISNGSFSFRSANPRKIRLSTVADTSSQVLGVMVYDVREFDENGQKLIFQPGYKRAEMCVVTSGESVPVVSRGILEIAGFSGVAGAGVGAYVGLGGDIAASATSSGLGPLVGKFLSTSGADGYALIKISL